MNRQPAKEQNVDTRHASFSSMVLAASIGAMISSYIVIRTHRDNVQSNYINPNNIILRDLDKSDGEGLRETYLKIDDKLYELKYDSERQPVVIPSKKDN